MQQQHCNSNRSTGNTSQQLHQLLNIELCAQAQTITPFGDLDQDQDSPFRRPCPPALVSFARFLIKTSKRDFDLGDFEELPAVCL